MDENNIVHLSSSENASEKLLVQELWKDVQRFETFLQENNNPSSLQPYELQDVVTALSANLNDCGNALIVIMKRRNDTSYKELLAIGEESKFNAAYSYFLSLEETAMSLVFMLQKQNMMTEKDLKIIEEIFDNFAERFQNINNNPSRSSSKEEAYSYPILSPKEMDLTNAKKVAAQTYKDAVRINNLYVHSAIAPEIQGFFNSLGRFIGQYNNQIDGFSIQEHTDPKIIMRWVTQIKIILDLIKERPPKPRLVPDNKDD